jgi:mannose-6-phosphate isomerase
MHLFEAMIAAFDATHDMVFQNRAGNFFSLFLANLYDKQRQVLGEYFEEDFSKIEPVSVEPGHQAEWVWLLKGFERITGCPTGRPRAELLATALRYRDEATGCLVDEGDTEGNIKRHTRRLWPQTEIAKAWIAQAEAGEAARAALSPAPRRRRLVRPVRSRRRVAGRHDPCVFVLSCALRGRGSRAGARLSTRGITATASFA